MMMKEQLSTLVNEKLHALYSECMNCKNTSEACPGILKDIAKGVPPRGFYFEVSPVDILVVAKNPGHPFHREPELFAGLTGNELYQEYRRFQSGFYSLPDERKETSSRFRRNLLRYVGIFLDVPSTEVYQYAAHTNLVKCSTVNERGVLDRQTKEECYQIYFVREVELFQPKVLLALGREVEYFLLHKSWKLGIPIIYVRHPSYYYPKEQESEILENIKEEIRKFI